MGCRRGKLARLRKFSALTLSSQDTFVVGCAFSDKNIYPETFAGNPDTYDAVYSTKYGIYEAHCGLDNVMISWGHDEVGHLLLSDK